MAQKITPGNSAEQTAYDRAFDRAQHEGASMAESQRRGRLAVTLEREKVAEDERRTRAREEFERAS